MTQNFFQSFVLLLLVTDPFGNVPLFVSALHRVEPHRRAKVILRECGIAYLILLLFMLFGSYFMQALQLSEISLRIGGGVILFLIALRMVFPQADGIFGHVDSALDNEPFIVPLAIPALAGPSALVTVLLFSSQAKMSMGYYLLVLSLVALCWLIILLSADRLQRVLGARVITAFERLMGLLLTAMAIEMLLAGLSIYLGTLPVLSH